MAKPKLNEKYALLSPTGVDRTFDLDTFEPPSGVESFELDAATPLAPRWKRPGTGTLKDGNANKPLLGDCVLNTDSLLVVSERLRAAMETAGITDVEFLPLTLTLKGKAIDQRYFVAHLLKHVDCLDVKASGATFGFNKRRIDRVKKLVFSADPDCAAFQVANFNGHFFVRVDIAEALAFSGIRWVALDDYPNFDADRSTAHWKRVDAVYERCFRAKPQALTLGGQGTPPAVKKAKRASAADVKAWLKDTPAQGTFKKSAPFTPGEDETWLDAYSKSDWPGFDPKRYRAFGFDGQGNHWLLDLDRAGAVVFFSHETGYGEEHFELCAPSMKQFAALVK